MISLAQTEKATCAAGGPTVACMRKTRFDPTKRGHGGASLAPRYSVLIVDPLEETREVLRTALESRGVRILATG